MNLGLILLDCEDYLVEFLHARVLALSISLNIFLNFQIIGLRVGKMSEGKDLLRLVPAGVGRREDSHHVR